MKLRYWHRGDLPPASKLSSVTAERWLAAVMGAHADATQVAWRLAGHRTVAADWDTGRRQLDEHLVYLVSDGGACRLVLSDRTVQLHPGMLMWLAPGVWHRLTLADPSRAVTLYHMRLRVRSGESDICFEPAELILDDADHLRWEMEQIVDELFHQRPDAEIRCRAMLASLSVGVFRLRLRHSAGRAGLTGMQHGQLIDFARRHVAEWPRPADLARSLGLSPGYFARVFRDSLGQTPRRWLLEQRIHEAARLLTESNLNVSQVADRLGYRDVYLFSRQFKQVTGLSPTHYRQAF